MILPDSVIAIPFGGVTMNGLPDNVKQIKGNNKL